MGERRAIRDASQKIISWEEVESNGDIRVTDFYGRCLGWYRKDKDITTDFYGRILAHGDAHGMLFRDADK